MPAELLADEFWNADHDRAAEIVRCNPQLVNWRGSNGGTLLLQASGLEEHLTRARILLANGADVNARRVFQDGHCGNCPLHEAAIGGAVSIVTLLLENGAEVDAIGEHSMTPLERAVNGIRGYDYPEHERKSRDEIIRILLNNGARVRSIPVAAALGDLERIKQLVNEGGDPDEIMVDGCEHTALHFAALAGNRQMVTFLLSVIKDSLDFDELNGFTALDLAQNEQVKAILRAHGAQTRAEMDAMWALAMDAQSKNKRRDKFGNELGPFSNMDDRPASRRKPSDDQNK